MLISFRGGAKIVLCSVNSKPLLVIYNVAAEK